MRDNFDACLSHVLASEGGHVNDPRDPGGETNFGISKRSYPNEDIRNMTAARAGAIYRRDYWDAVSGDDLPAGLDLVAFDAAVNSGVLRGSKWLQTALSVTADGKIGPKTVAAANASNAATVAVAACNLRLAYLKGLSGWRFYSKGWTIRIEGVRSTAISMASRPVTTPAKATPANWLIGAGIAAVAAFIAYLKG